MPTITTGKYLKREELTEEGTKHTVVSIDQQSVSNPDGTSDDKWVLLLSGLKPLIMNATNIRVGVAAFGTSETDEWIGRPIVAYDDPTVEFGGKIVGGVRLRAVPKKVTKKADDDEPPF
jgi:hypothetical protein